MDVGVLLSVPTESIAIRVIVASVAGALLGRLMLRAGLRVAAVRAATALVPAASLVAVFLLFWGRLRLPDLMLPVDAVDALPVPVRDGYLHFAPMALPLIAGTWAVIAGSRIALRLRAIIRSRRAVLVAFNLRTTAPERVRRSVAAKAQAMRLTPPPVAVVPECHGGATVVGVRRPLLVFDEQLVERMDDEELDGVVAHELAHIRRCDNLVAFALGVVRDVFFFVPGGRWALRQLHTERELAADQAAVRVTGRPGALASGLLKVIDGAAPQTACAAFMPRGSLVDRVQHLVEPQPTASRMRSATEMLAVAGALGVAVASAAQFPTFLTGTAGARDAMAIVYARGEAAVDAVEEDLEARAFQVYRDTRLEGPVASTPTTTVVDDDPSEVSRAVLQACAEGGAACPTQERSTGLGLKPRTPDIVLDEQLVNRWRATAVVEGSDAPITLYWLERLEERLG